MIDKHDRVITGLERLANADGHALEIKIFERDGEWMILFKGGSAQVFTKISSFSRHPQIVLDPFCEELIKAAR